MSDSSAQLRYVHLEEQEVAMFRSTGTVNDLGEPSMDISNNTAVRLFEDRSIPVEGSFRDSRSDQWNGRLPESSCSRWRTTPGPDLLDGLLQLVNKEIAEFIGEEDDVKAFAKNENAIVHNIDGDPPRPNWTAPKPLMIFLGRLTLERGESDVLRSRHRSRRSVISSTLSSLCSTCI